MADAEELMARAGAHKLATKAGYPMQGSKLQKYYTESWPTEYDPEFNEVIKLMLRQ
jgi:hypothetical protein